MISFHIGKVPVSLRFSFLLIFSLFLLLDHLGIGLAFCCAVLIHELGHLLVMACLGLSVNEVELSAFGIAIQRKTEQSSGLWGELLLYLAGPVANLLAALFLFPRGEVAGAFHLLLGLLNFLPMKPMDGGQILSLALEHCLPWETARILEEIATALMDILLILAGLWLLNQRQNPALLVFSLILCLQQIKNF